MTFLIISTMQGVLGLASGALVGFSLGLVGGGGSILAVPLMVYVVGVSDAHVAIGTSAIAVAANAAINLSTHARDGTVRWGDPRQLAAMVLLITQSTIQSAQIVRPILNAEALATELAYSLNGYLS